MPESIRSQPRRGWANDGVYQMVSADCRRGSWKAMGGQFGPVGLREVSACKLPRQLNCSRRNWLTTACFPRSFRVVLASQLPARSKVASIIMHPYNSETFGEDFM